MTIAAMRVALFFLLTVTEGAAAFTLLAEQSSGRQSRVGCKQTQKTTHSPRPSLQLSMTGFLDDIQGDLQTRWKIFQDSEDDDFKQKIANVMAGEYDAQAAREELDTLIQSAPCVMFTWENSPSCKQAVAALETADAMVTIVRLDDPWSTGNVLRAELGKRVGRSSVPAIFVDGTYVGGYDGGVGDDAPGILNMAFAGTLRPKLEAVGALKTSESE